MGVLDFEWLAARNSRRSPEVLFRSKTARSVVIVLVFLPSRDLVIEQERLQSHALAVVTHAIFLSDPLALLGVDPVTAFDVVITIREFFVRRPVIWPACFLWHSESILASISSRESRIRIVVGMLDRLQLLDHDREDVDVPEVTPRQEGQRRQGLEELLEHERDPAALGEIT